MEPAPELAEFVERILRNWTSNRVEDAVDAISRHEGTVVIGFDAREWWEGFETVSALLRVQAQEVVGALIPEFTVDPPVAWKEGTVGWVSTRSHLVVEGLKPIDTRWTLVLHEEGAFWRVVQWHLSIGVSNEEATGATLTTSLDDLLILVQDEAPPASSVAENGSVTIVFTDIEGSTALMESLGEPRWLEMLAWHDAVVTRQTQTFGGSVVKGQGDGFMLAFPAAGSAVACAVAIERALSAGWNGVQVPVRIGMHSGNARSEGGDFFGRTVVVAARIASAAAPGEILVSQSVQESLGGAFNLDGQRSLDLKGLSGDHSAFAVRWQ